MEPESAKTAGSGPEAAADRASPDDTTRKQAEQETIAASASSFRGLIGAPDGSSIGQVTSGPRDSAQIPSIGQTLGRYQIQKMLGSGSMGSVFLAHDSQLDRGVALKVPRLDRNSTGELLQRLHREARAAATLNHPNICPIYDVNEHAGTWFIAMGYVSGQPLSAYIASKKQQPEREAAKVVRKVALALQEAHGQGILHRDLKPTNIMIDKRGEPIVMDFGVACWFEDQTQTRLTQQGALVGTPAYMSPEQIEGRIKVGPTSDVYSLGVILYQILTGRCPFEGTVLNVISQVLHEIPPDATEFRPHLSPELAAICNRAMQKNPAERFPSMLDFAKALTAFLNGAPGGERPQKGSAQAETIEIVRPEPARAKRASRPPVPPTLPRRTGPRRQPKKSQKSWLPAAVAAGAVTALLVVGALLGAMLVRGRGTPEVAATNQMAIAATDLAAPTKRVESPIAGPSTPVPRPPAIPGTVAGPNPAPGSNSPGALPKPLLPTNVVSATPRSSVGGAPGANTVSASSLSPSDSLPPNPVILNPVILQPKIVQPGIPKPAVSPKPGATAPRGEPTPQPAAGARALSTHAHSSGRVANSDSDRPTSSTNDDDAPPASKQPRRGMRREPADDRPPPEGPEGRRPFDGGPPKGMTIEEYFKRHDINSDGKLDPSELPMHVIVRADSNKDGELSLRELQQAFKRRGKKLFTRPTAAEMRRLPRGGPRPPFDGPEPLDPPGRPERPAGPSGF